MPGPLSEIEILYNPSLLIGMQVCHQFLDEDGNLEWYNGVIVGRSDETEFEVVYSDQDEVYQFDLLADYCEGDLKFGFSFVLFFDVVDSKICLSFHVNSAR